MTSPLVHPRKQKQRQQFYPHTVTIGKIGGNAKSHDERNYQFTPLDGHAGLVCAYGPKEGGKPGAFQTDASSGESILIPGLYTQIVNKMQAVLTLDTGQKMYFTINDVVRSAGKTLLSVSPR
jgi:hypothetical protein